MNLIFHNFKVQILDFKIFQNFFEVKLNKTRTPPRLVKSPHPTIYDMEANCFAVSEKTENQARPSLNGGGNLATGTQNMGRSTVRKHEVT